MAARTSVLSRWSILSVLFVGSLLAAVMSWHKEMVNDGSSHPSAEVENGHRILKDFYDDDDTYSTDTCKGYLQNFLNGTTDCNDQCLAFKKAYNAADCKQSNDDDNTDTPDDGQSNVGIDDFFEAWECCDSMEKFYDITCLSETNENIQSVRLLGIMLVLLCCTTVKAMLKRARILWLPDACAFILVGALVGGLLRLFDADLVKTKLLSFDQELFLQILLPPIIFNAALSIDKRAFRRDFFPILSFAGLGTAFSSITIGLLTHHVSKWTSSGGTDDHLPLLDSLVFGSLISSIDPVATLSILAGVGVGKTDTLYTLIFGESLLNDGVAIVLFDVLRGYLGQSEDVLGKYAYIHILKRFCSILFGSIGIGLAGGLCCTFFFWHLRGRQSAVTEVVVFFCWALIPYYVADGLGCSGIIAIMVMGFFLDYFVIGGQHRSSEESFYSEYSAMTQEDDDDDVALQSLPSHNTDFNTSAQEAFCGQGHLLRLSRHHVGFVAEVIASIMDTAIFAYLGLFLFNDNFGILRLNVTAVLSCVSSRAIMVVGLGFLINVAVFFDFENQIGQCLHSCRRTVSFEEHVSLQDSRVYLDRRTQVILLLAGVRGAVSFALVENIPVWDPVSKSGSKFKPELKAMTSSAIVFTLFVFGALTYVTVKQGLDPNDSQSAPHLSHRLMSDNLNGDSDNQSTPMAVEMEETAISSGYIAPSNDQPSDWFRTTSDPQSQPT